jgi:glycosyltransferase involved in cell wall biosynthesis
MTIEFEKDLYSLYQLFDVYVHVPVDECAEAFGQTYVEALAAGIPSVFTLSGVAREFVKNEKNALVVPFKDTNAIYESIVRLLDNNHLAEQLSVQGKEDVNQLFVIDKMMNSLFLLYEKRA